MRDSKLGKALSSLDAWEQRHFLDFVHSPFFNKHTGVAQLVEELLVVIRRENGAISQEELYAKVCPGEPYQHQRSKDLLSAAMKLYREFLAYYQFRQDERRRDLARLDAHLARQMDRPFLKLLDRAENYLYKDDLSLAQRHHHRLTLQEKRLDFLTRKASRSGDDSIQKASDLLDRYYLLSRLSFGLELANRQQVIGLESDSGLLSSVLDYLRHQSEILDKYPELKLYYLIFRSYTEPDPPFSEFLTELRNWAGHLPATELTTLYYYASNFCIRRINAGQRNYLQTLLGLYRWALEEGVLYGTDGHLSQWDYKNVVSASLKAGEKEWCLNFIETYVEQLAPEFRENARTYNLAVWHFENQDYSQALRMLQTVEFSDVFYALGSRVILLKCYFSTGDLDAALSLCESFQMYLRRNKSLSKAQLGLYQNLVRFARKMARLKQQEALLANEKYEERREKLRWLIQKSGGTAQAAWLLGEL